ncbi:hypothetical protein [Shewanella algae]|uniref:hypothetical protein n=1 Tax=Shewanella algae TaxID=38313 RepID=UPI0031F4C154
MGISGSSSAIPNLANKALLADIQAFEPYASSALNRKLRGIINPGIYHGFDVVPGEGLAVLIQSPGDSAAAVEVGESYLLTVRQQASVSVPVPAGRRSVICLKVVYSIDIETDQVNADSQVKAAEIVAVNVGDEPAGSIILAEVNVPSDVTAITAPMIDLLRRQSVSLEGFWEKINSGEIRPKLGLWARAQPEKGFLPAADKTGAEAKESIGKPGAWFKEVWANAFRGGSIDVTGPIKSGGKNAMLVGDYGLGGASMLLNDGYDLRKLPAANAYYRGQKLLNAPGNSAEWFYIKTEVHSDGYMRIEASNFGGSKEFWCTNVNGKWSEWNTRYSTNFKPTATDVGLGNLSIGRNNTLAITTAYGLTYIGMLNATWAHYDTTATEGHYFYKKVQVGDDFQASKGANVLGNLSVNGNLVGNGKTVLSTQDGWLRFNPNGHFGTGVYFANSLVRTDGAYVIGDFSIASNSLATRLPAHSSWGADKNAAFDVTGAPTTGSTATYMIRYRDTAGARLFAIDVLDQTGDTRFWAGKTGSYMHLAANGVLSTSYQGALYGDNRKPTANDVGLSNYKNASLSSYGSVSIDGSKGGYAGIHFEDAARTLMVGSSAQGFHTGSAWQWYFNNGVLAAGTVPWANLSGIPVYATRWPSKSEVGLSNVPNTVHSSAATANTVAVRDAAGDLFARLFRSNYANQNTISGAIAFRINNSSDSYLRFCSDPAAVRAWLGAAAANHSHTWAQISGIPATATRWPSWGEVSGKPTYATRWPTWNEVSSKPTYALRWPTWDEVSGKPTFAANPFIKFYDSVGISKLRLPTAAINHLKAGRDVEVRWLMKLDYLMKWETQLLIGSTWSQRPSYRGLSQDVSWWWIYTGYHTSSGNDGCIVTESNRLIRAEYRLL